MDALSLSFLAQADFYLNDRILLYKGALNYRHLPQQADFQLSTHFPKNSISLHK